MIKMVVSSFYNTLINEEEAIPSSTMLEIDRIRNKGVVFSICTNRLAKEVLDYNRDFPFIDYIVSLNGSCIYDVEKKKFFSKSKLSIANIKKLSNIFQDYKMTYYTEENAYSNLDDVKDQDIYKIEVEMETEEDRKKIEKLTITSSVFCWNNKKYLEITSNRSSMFTGVDQVSLKLGISLKEIVTICANESEYALAKNIDKSYIVRNGCDLLKKTTKKITKSNEEKGVELILKKV